MNDMKIPCLKDGIFARSTLKPLESVFDFEEEKRKIVFYSINGEWFVVSGLRRTGKTTLVRSVCNAIDVLPIYVNLWEIHGERKEALVLEKIVNDLKEKVKRLKLRDVLGRIQKIGFLEVSVDLRERNKTKLENILVSLSNKKKIVLILDEIQVMRGERSFFEYLAALHDIASPNISVVFLGSIVSLKQILEENYAKPLFGRLGDEIRLSPLKNYEAIGMLRKGYSQCDVSVNDDLIIEAARRLGGFPGWIASFGRLSVLDYYITGKFDIEKVYDRLIKEAKQVIYDEIARAILGRRNIRGYLKILRYLGEHGEITVSKTARIIEKKPNTALIYINHLVNVGIITKIKDRYVVSDPILREVLAEKNMEKEVKIRL